MAIGLLILVAGGFHVALAAVTGLGYDESYWVVLSRTPSLSYVDDPPLTAWIVAAWRALTGAATPLWLRLPFVGLFAGSTWLMYRLTAKVFGGRAGFWAALAFNLAPVFAWGHSTWVLPDGPLIFFLLAAANLLARPLFAQDAEAPALGFWIAAGICGGMAFLAKYHAAFLFAGTLIFLLTVPSRRRLLLTPGPWAGALAGALVFSPVVVWNIQQQFAGLLFQSGRLHAAPSAAAFAAMLGGSAAFLSWLIVPLAYGLWRALRGGAAAGREASWWLALMALGPILVFTAAAAWSAPFPHWAMPGWLFAFPLLGELMQSLERRRPRLVQLSFAVWAGVFIAISVLLAAQSAANVLTRMTPRIAGRTDPTAELVDWSALREALTARGLIDATSPAVGTVHWMEAAKASYALGPAIPVLCLCDIPQHFALLSNPAAFIGRDLILVGRESMLGARVGGLEPLFERIEPLEPVIVRRAGAPVLTLRLYRGVGFKDR